MIFGAVADTHAAIWYLFDDLRLSREVKVLMERMAAGSQRIAVSSITLVELVYLVEKGRVGAEIYDVLKSALSDPFHVLVEAPVDAGVAESMRKVSRTEIPDMPDRIIAATAVHLAVPVISRDRLIRGANIQTIW